MYGDVWCCIGVYGVVYSTIIIGMLRYIIIIIYEVPTTKTWLGFWWTACGVAIVSTWVRQESWNESERGRMDPTFE